MRVFLKVDSYGRITHQFTTSEDSDYRELDSDVIEVESPLASVNHYVDATGSIQELPVAPTVWHTWTGEQWEDLRSDQERELHTAELWDLVRLKRDKLLQESDGPVQRMRDYGEAIPRNILDYRQQLRDVTLQADPLNITWPVKPE